MVQVTKQALQQWVMMEYLSKKHRYQSNNALFERKYRMSFEAFEKRIESAADEVVEEWDDYVEWKADHEFLRVVNQQIQDIQNGDIEYVG